MRARSSQDVLIGVASSHAEPLQHFTWWECWISYVGFMQDREVRAALLGAMAEAHLLDSAAQYDAEKVADRALMEHKDFIMCGPTDIRKVYKRQIGPMMCGYGSRGISLQEMLMLLRYVYSDPSGPESTQEFDQDSEFESESASE